MTKNTNLSHDLGDENKTPYSKRTAGVYLLIGILLLAALFCAADYFIGQIRN